jgi:hypothetical protein
MEQLRKYWVESQNNLILRLSLRGHASEKDTVRAPNLGNRWYCPRFTEAEGLRNAISSELKWLNAFSRCYIEIASMQPC